MNEYKKWKIVLIISVIILVIMLGFVVYQMIDVYINGIVNMAHDKFYGIEAIKNLFGWYFLLIIFAPKYLIVVIIFIINIILLVTSIRKLKKMKK